MCQEGGRSFGIIRNVRRASAEPDGEHGDGTAIHALDREGDRVLFPAQPKGYLLDKNTRIKTDPDDTRIKV
jgi:hypothetical protein